MSSTDKKLKMKPYARLLTMLGEQLIKNERIALIELIKNSYDADAAWVKVSFNNFSDNFSIKENSTIVIEDNGHGMSEQVIENHLLNPATPDKKIRKMAKPTTKKGRVIQGEKGIGRFSMLKLGKKIQIITRATDEDVERVVDYDFSKYDDEFLMENGAKKDLFLDDLTVSVKTRHPVVINNAEMLLGTRKLSRGKSGTRIEISDLKGSWSIEKADGVYKDITKLDSIFFVKDIGTKKHEIEKDFEIFVYKDLEWQKIYEEYLQKLRILLEDRAVFRIEGGRYDEIKQEFSFKLNGVSKTLELSNPAISGLTVFRKYFGDHGEVLKERKTDCGSFGFNFFIFDFTADAPAKFRLDKEDKELIRGHRIYLYRDGIRVYPYGEPDDDWLKIDMYRGTISAGHFLSNDQVVGYVNISQMENEKLKDKTNREGLIEKDNATADFIALLQSILAYLRQKAYAEYLKGLQDKKVHDIVKAEQVQEELNQLKEEVSDNPKVLGLVAKIEKDYRAERKYLIQRAETTEQLAGVGLSVETASHDVMAIMGKATTSLDSLISDLLRGGELDGAEIQKELQSLRGMLSFVEAQLKDIQLLFKSSKQKRRSIRLKEILEKVERIYKRLLKKEGIELTVEEVGPPLIAKTTDAVLLQLLLNLFDNSVYWLQQSARKQKKIGITLDGSHGKLIFSDNGPGVSKDDAPYIFEPFFSGKGEDGRGLGLYIARQLLERNDYTIELADLKADLILPGANFVVSFVSEEK